MFYQNFKTMAIHAKLNQNPGKPTDLYKDIYYGYQYLEAMKYGLIKEDDTLVLFSLDGAQLYHDKNSDCYFFIWIILNLSPNLCYKKAYILPGGFVPGPNSPSHSYSQAFDMSLPFNVRGALLSGVVRDNKFALQIFLQQQQAMRTQ